MQLAGATVTTSTFTGLASALDYPVQPIRWTIGFPPGAAGDVQMRIMGRWLSERLGRPVVIENKPGAGSNIAVQAVINLPADGHTLFFVSPANAINATLYENLAFNFLRDIAAVAGLVKSPLVMEVHPSVPAKTVAEFIAYAKANPGRINMASGGVGTTSHLAGELFKAMSDVNLVHVPYRGAAPALTDLIGGQVQVTFDVVAGSRAHIAAGRLRALAVTTPARLEIMPDLPTVGEAVPGYEVSGWSGVGVRVGTPREIIERLNREINAGLADPAVRARLADVATTPIFFTPDEFGAYMASEVEKWGKVVRVSGIRPE